MLAERHISPLFLYSVLSSHNVMNSQVWWKLQVVVTCRNFAFYVSVTNLLRAALIILFIPTDSFQAIVNHKVLLYSKYSVGSGRKLKWPASLETENIHLYCTDEKTAFTTVLLQYHTAINLAKWSIRRITVKFMKYFIRPFIVKSTSSNMHGHLIFLELCAVAPRMQVNTDSSPVTTFSSEIFSY